MPATPRCTVKPCCSSVAVRYFDVSYSWKPSSPKENRLSLITCASLACSFTASITRAFNPLVLISLIRRAPAVRCRQYTMRCFPCKAAGKPGMLSRDAIA